MTQIDDLESVQMEYYKRGFNDGRKSPRTITREELEMAVTAYKSAWKESDNIKTAIDVLLFENTNAVDCMKVALSILGITVEGE